MPKFTSFTFVDVRVWMRVCVAGGCVSGGVCVMCVVCVDGISGVCCECADNTSELCSVC